MNSVELLTDKRLSAVVLDPLFERIQHDLKIAGRAGRLATVKERLGHEGARRAALTFVIQMMGADRILKTSERALIPEITDALGLDPKLADDEVSALSRRVRT